MTSQFSSIRRRAYSAFEYAGDSAHRILMRRPFMPKRNRRILLLSMAGRIPQSQIFPLYYFQHRLQERWSHQVREIDVNLFERRPESAPSGAHVVVVQTSFDWTSDRYDRLFENVRRLNPDAKIVYMDWFAPTDLRLASKIDSYIDIYIKKHILKDRSSYGLPTRGDTNLVDYYGSLCKIDYPVTCYPIPTGFLSKLRVGPTFCVGRSILPHFYLNAKPEFGERSIDIHARLAVAGEGWYGRMREMALSHVSGIDGFNLAIGNGVPHAEYMREMSLSKTCFSPFGYGEVCWRDYEAVLAGALLVKPSMNHIEVTPDIFIENETYVPVSWDFNDLAAVLRWWIGHRTHREKVCASAYSVVHNYLKSERVIDDHAAIFEFD